MSDRLPIELRVDPSAPRGELTSALACLLLARARAAVGERGEAQAAGDGKKTGRRASPAHAGPESTTPVR
jgi:hypothetical protein